MAIQWKTRALLQRELDAYSIIKALWFQVDGKPITNVTTQKAIVEELLGEAKSLSEDDEEHRSKYYVQFLKDAEQDGGYRRIDVPSIAYQFRDKWGKGI